MACHLPLSGGGLTVRTFQTGLGYLTRNAAEELDELRSVWQELGVRTSMSVPLEVPGVARGVFVASAEESLRQAALALIGILTPRQQEVAALVAQGLTNEEIAFRLVLAPGTVANHVGSILERLGVRSRSQVAVWAAERGLTQRSETSHEAV